MRRCAHGKVACGGGDTVLVKVVVKVVVQVVGLTVVTLLVTLLVNLLVNLLVEALVNLLVMSLVKAQVKALVQLALPIISLSACLIEASPARVLQVQLSPLERREERLGTVGEETLTPRLLPPPLLAPRSQRLLGSASPRPRDDTRAALELRAVELAEDGAKELLTGGEEHAVECRARRTGARAGNLAASARGGRAVRMRESRHVRC